jgi:hypothetical protein
MSMDLSFLGKKTQADPPQAVFVRDTPEGYWVYKVTKTYQNDQSQQYARWMVSCSSPYTFGGSDMGDTYVTDVLFGRAALTEVNGRMPTFDEIDEVTYLRQRIVARA